MPEDNGLIEDEAIAWFVAMQGPDAVAKSAAFSAWMARSPAHDAAFDRIANLHRDAAVLKRSRIYGPHRRSDYSKLVPVAALLIVLALVLTPFALFNQRGMIIGKSDVQHAELVGPEGAIRTVRLVDGSQVTLDASARVAVDIDKDARNVSLEAGRARFAFADDPRPYAVTAAGGMITGAAAEIDLTYDGPGLVAVTLWRGDARAMPRPARMRPAALITPLRAGQQALFRANDFAKADRAVPRAENSTRDWPQGWADFRSVPLGRLAEIVNGYVQGPRLVIDDPQTARLQVAGRFRVTDSTAVAARLEEVFDLSVTRQDGALHLGDRRKIEAAY